MIAKKNSIKDVRITVPHKKGDSRRSSLAGVIRM
jgi:hypothetical protein